MSKLSKYFKNFLVFLCSHFRINTRPHEPWNGQHRLAQSPTTPRLRSDHLRPGAYSHPNAQPKRHKYTPEEVKRMLRGLETNEWSPPVLAQATTISTLLDERMLRYFRGRERLFHRLPYVLAQYIQGKPCFDIARSVSFFSDGDDVEDTINFASRLIAAKLNRQYWRTSFLDF
jgi:hypothetical protein